MGCFVRGGKKWHGMLCLGDKNSMGCYVRGDKYSMGCFVRGGKSLWDVLSRVSKNGMGCFVRLPCSEYLRTRIFMDLNKKSSLNIRHCRLGIVGSRSFFLFYTPPLKCVEVLCYTLRCLSVCPSVRPSVRAHHFQSIT